MTRRFDRTDTNTNSGKLLRSNEPSAECCVVRTILVLLFLVNLKRQAGFGKKPRCGNPSCYEFQSNSRPFRLQSKPNESPCHGRPKRVPDPAVDYPDFPVFSIIRRNRARKEKRATSRGKHTSAVVHLENLLPIPQYLKILNKYDGRLVQQNTMRGDSVTPDPLIASPNRKSRITIQRRMSHRNSTN